MATKSVRFKPGMVVEIISEYTGLGTSFKISNKSELVSKFGYEKGEKVRLYSYDSSDETWRVEKNVGVSIAHPIWIKCKNLAPIYVENNPFKVGDKVELIDAQFDWVQSEGATTGVVYEVIDVSKFDPVSQPTPFIKIKGGDAKSRFWIESAAFKKLEPASKLKEGDRVKLLNDSEWSLAERLKVGEVFTVAKVSKAGSGDYIRVEKENGLMGTYWIHTEQFALVEAAVSDMSKQIIQVMCIDNELVAGLLTRGKLYNVIKEDDKYYKILRDDSSAPLWFDKRRFVVVNSDVTSTQKTLHNSKWAVGDTLTEEMLNGKGVIFHGFSTNNGEWGLRPKFMKIHKDREIERIGEYKGRLAGLLSGTLSIWVDIQSLPPIPEKEDTEGIVEMVCINANGWSDYLTEGKTYKIHTKRQCNGMEGVCKVSGLNQPFGGPTGGIDKDGTLYLTIDEYFALPNKVESPLQEFKVGDRVRFIQAKTPNSFYELATYFSKEDKLVDGNIYTVLKPSTNGSTSQDLPLRFIQLEGESVFNHPVDCFEKVKKVMCVDNSSGASFTIGKVYEVTGETVDYYRLTDDSGRPNQGMWKHRFVEITDDIDKVA